MAPFCRHRTIPGCPDAYRRFSARYNPRLMRGGPPRRTEACARRPPRTPHGWGSICVATLQKRGLLPLSTHQPPLTPLKRPTLPTAQGLAQAEKPNPACKAASRRPLSSPRRRMARSADLRLSSPEAVAATSLSHSGSSAAMSPRTSSAASPKFTRWQQAAFTASQRSHIETLLQGHNRSGDHELLHQRHVPRAEASPLRRPWPETSTHQGRHGDATVEAAR